MTLDELETHIATTDGNRLIIGLDGLDGAGKTTLGRELASRLKADLVSVDDYIVQNTGKYLNAIRQVDLSNALLSAASRVVIVEGICLREVAALCDLPIGMYVYVRRMEADGGWLAEAQCRPTEAAEILKRRELNDRNLISRALGGESVTDLGVHGELIDYHCKYRPFENADFVVDVIEHVHPLCEPEGP